MGLSDPAGLSDIVETIRQEVGAIAGVPQSLHAALDEVFLRAEATVRSRTESLMATELNESAATLPLKPESIQSAERAVKRASRSADRALRHREAGLDRDYLEGRFGIKKPQPQAKQRSVGGRRGGTVASAINTGPNALLPMVNRRDPSTSPPAVFPADLEHGVANLQNRGFIPPAADVTPAFIHDPAPVTAGQSPLYPHQEQFLKSEIYSSPFGFNAVNLKLDLVTHTHTEAGSASSKPARGTKAHRSTESNTSAAGWAQTNQIQRHDALDLVDHSDSLIPADTQAELGDAAASLAAAERAGDFAAIKTATDRVARAHGMIASDSATGLPNAQRLRQNTVANGESEQPTQVHTETLSCNALRRPDRQDRAAFYATGEDVGDHLIIRGGRLIKTPSLKDFLRKHRARAGVLKDLLVMLEGTLSRYAIPLGVVDCVLLVRLANRGDGDLCEPSDNQLVLTLVNADEVLTIMDFPGRVYRGAEGPDAAATAIQAGWRGATARRDYELHTTVEKAAKTIAARWRLHWQKRQAESQIGELRIQREQSWRAVQALFRDEWHNIRGKARVEVHVPSLSWSRNQRLSVSNLSARQNCQMARLCRLSDPLLDVVYVSPFPLSDDVAQYYHKLLGVGGVAEAGSRYRIVYPENYDRLPYGMSLTSLLLYSPRCLRRIRNFCRGKNAYVVPSVIGPEDKLLAQILGLPMLGTEPSISSLIGSKAGSKQVFVDAAVHVPAGSGAGHSEMDFFERLAKLIIDNTQIPRWIFKVGDEFNGRGHAHFDVGYLRTHRKLASSPMKELAEAEIVHFHHEVVEELRATINKRVGITANAVYRSWSEFIGALVSRGGVIEACPSRVSGSPSANMFIQPSGEVSLLCTHDQMFSPPYCFVGASFPQSSVPFAALRAAALAVGIACAARGVIGFVGVDFVAHQDKDGLRLLAVDLNLRYTDTLAAFHMFAFLMGGQYDDLLTGRYFVDDRPGGVLPTPLSAEQVSQPSAYHLSTRHYVASQYIRHPNLATIQYSNFFNLCRMKGISFDLQQKRGTAFNLVDSFATGALGIMGVGSSLLDCFSTVERGLLFVQKQVGVHKPSSQSDDANFKDILGSVKFVVEILRAQNGQ